MVPLTTGKVIDLKTKEAVKAHSKIPHEDMDWAFQESPTVLRLFMESWRCEPFGRQQRILKTKFQGDNLRKAMRPIERAGLFKYFPVTELIKKRWVITGWKCENLHGYYTSYWDTPSDDANPVPTENRDVPTENRDVPTVNSDIPTKNRDVPIENRKREAETLSSQRVQNCQPRFNYGLTTYQPPSKEVGSVVSSPSKETEALEALPTMPDGLPEEESPQGASDCPAASGGTKEGDIPPALLEASTEGAGKEPKDLDGDKFSGAGADVKICNAQPSNDQPQNVEVITAEEVEKLRGWMMKNIFHRPSYPGRERLEDWLIEQLVRSSNFRRGLFLDRFKGVERFRPGASIKDLITKALPALEKDFELPDEL